MVNHAKTKANVHPPCPRCGGFFIKILAPDPGRQINWLFFCGISPKGPRVLRVGDSVKGHCHHGAINLGTVVANKPIRPRIPSLWSVVKVQDDQNN